jgi:hypothetical protein
MGKAILAAAPARRRAHRGGADRSDAPDVGKEIAPRAS